MDETKTATIHPTIKVAFSASGTAKGNEGLATYDYVSGKDIYYTYTIEEGDEGYTEYDYYDNELNRKTPLIIWTKDNKHKQEVDYYMGMIDVLPTIGNMMGFKSDYALGHDIFDIKENNTIVFPNGNFLTENVYYNNSKSEYKVLKNSAMLDESYIEERKKYAEEVLEISNGIIVYDLIKQEGDKITHEETPS